MINKLNKMIETLNKFSIEGKDTELSRRLLRNLNEISSFIRSSDLNKYVDVKEIESVTAKQSMISCVENSSKVLGQIEKRRMMKDLSKAPESLAQEIRDAGFDEDYE